MEKCFSCLIHNLNFLMRLLLKSWGIIFKFFQQGPFLKHLSNSSKKLKTSQVINFESCLGLDVILKLGKNYDSQKHSKLKNCAVIFL